MLKRSQPLHLSMFNSSGPGQAGSPRNRKGEWSYSDSRGFSQVCDTDLRAVDDSQAERQSKCPTNDGANLSATRRPARAHANICCSLIEIHFTVDLGRKPVRTAMKGSFLSPRGRGGLFIKAPSSDEPENQGSLLTNATQSDFPSPLVSSGRPPFRPIFINSP
jgi:hypothetical protein